MRVSSQFTLFLLQSIIAGVQLETCQFAEKREIIPETRTLARLGGKHGVASKRPLKYVSGNIGQIQGTGGSPNGGSGIIHGSNGDLINNKFLDQTGQSKNNLHHRLNNFAHKHGLGISGSSSGGINQSHLNAGFSSLHGLATPNSATSFQPNTNVEGGSPSATLGGIIFHGNHPHHSHHLSGALGGHSHHLHHLSHHAAVGSGQHHHGHGAVLGLGGNNFANGGAGVLTGQTHGHHINSLGLLQGGSLGVGGGVGGMGHRPLGGLGLIYGGNNGNQLSVPNNNNLINATPQTINSRPTQSHGGLLGLIHSRPGIGNGIFQSTVGGSNILGQHGGMGLIHSSHTGNSLTGGGTYQHVSGQQQGLQGMFNGHGVSTVTAPNYQSSEHGVSSLQVLNQQNSQLGGLGYTGSTQGQSTGFNNGGGGLFYGYQNQRPQGIVHQIHWSQPTGYITNAGNTQSQSLHAGSQGVLNGHENLSGNFNQMSQTQVTNGYNNHPELTSQNTNQASPSHVGVTHAQQGAIINNNQINSVQNHGSLSNQLNNNANINYGGSNVGSSGNFIYGSGISQNHGNTGQENHFVSGQNVATNSGLSASSSPNIFTATQQQAPSSNGVSGSILGNSAVVGTSQSQSTSGSQTQSGIWNSGSLNGMGNGYYSGSSGITNIYGSGAIAQTQGNNGQNYVPNGVYGMTAGNSNSSSQSINSNLQGQEYNLGSNTGHLLITSSGSGVQLNQGSNNQHQSAAGGYYTGAIAGSQGNQVQNIGTTSNVEGNSGHTSSLVGGYFTGANSESSYATSSASQSQGSSNHLSSTVSESHISSNKGPSGTLSHGSSSQTQAEVSNTAASSSSAASGGAHSSSNSYGGSFYVASQGQPTSFQTNTWSNIKPVNQLEGSITYDINTSNTDTNNKKPNLAVQNVVFSDEYVEDDSAYQSSEAEKGTENSGTFVASGHVSGDKISQIGGSLNSNTSPPINEHNSAGVGSGIYHGGQASSETNGQYNSSHSSTNGGSGSIIHSGNSELQQGVQFGLLGQSSGSHGSEVEFGGSSTNKESINMQQSPNYNSGFSLSMSSNPNIPQVSGLSLGSSTSNLPGVKPQSEGIAQIQEGSAGGTNEASHLTGSGNINLDNNIASGNTMSSSSNLSGLSGLNAVENGQTNVHLLSSGNGSSINSNNELNMPTGNAENTLGSGVYSSGTASGRPGFNSQLSSTASSGIDSSLSNNMGIQSSSSQTQSNLHEVGSSNTASNSFQTLQNTNGVFTGQMSIGNQQNNNGYYNVNSNVQQSSISSGNNANLQQQENNNSNSESSELSGTYSSSNGEGSSQFSGFSNNIQNSKPEISGSGTYGNAGIAGFNNNGANTFSSMSTNGAHVSGSSQGTFSSNHQSTINPANQWSSGITLSQNNMEGSQSSLVSNNAGQYSENNNFELSHSSKPTYGENFNSNNIKPITSQSSGQLSSSSSTSLSGSGDVMGSTEVHNNHVVQGSSGLQSNSESYNQNGGNLFGNGNIGGASTFHTQGGPGAAINKQTQSSLHFSRYGNPVQYEERYIFVPEMFSYNTGSSTVDGLKNKNTQQREYTVMYTENGPYIVKELPPAFGSTQVRDNQNNGGMVESYYLNEHLPQVSTAYQSMTDHSVDKTVVPMSQDIPGVTGEISGHLGKQGNFQGLLSIPSRIVGVLSGVGNSLGGVVSHGIIGGFQGNAEHSGEVSFEGEINHYPIVSGSIHGNFENHISGSGSVESSPEKKLI